MWTFECVRSTFVAKARHISLSIISPFEIYFWTACAHPPCALHYDRLPIFLDVWVSPCVSTYGLFCLLDLMLRLIFLVTTLAQVKRSGQMLSLALLSVASQFSSVFSPGPPAQGKLPCVGSFWLTLTPVLGPSTGQVSDEDHE